MWESLYLYLACGAVAGLAAGLFGIGGGIVIVPFLAWLFPRAGFPSDLVMVTAVATSLATIGVTSVSSVLMHHRNGAVSWSVVSYLAPGIVAGSVLGPIVAEQLPVPIFKALFGIFLWWVAARTLAGPVGTFGDRQRPSPVAFPAYGMAIGLSSSVLGIGGGTLSVPFLLRKGYPMRNAIAIAGACGFPIAVVGTASYLLLGWRHASMPPLSAGYVFIPAFVGITLASVPFASVGAWLAHRVPARALKRAFAVILIGVGARLLWQGVGPLSQMLLSDFRPLHP